MRRRVVGLTLAITSLVVIAFTVPLLFLVRRQAEERGQVAAQRQAQSTASLVALATASFDTFDRDQLASALGDLPTGVGVLLPDGSRLGDVPSAGDVVARARLGTPAAEYGPETWQVAIPVATRFGLLAVFAQTPLAELRRGVGLASAALVGLGLAVITAAAALAWRMGKELVRPVDELAEVATSLGAGDLEARASEAGTPEVAAVGHALNQLAGRLRQMIASERESLADLSHQLRTPLAGLKLQAERSRESEMGEAVAQMEAAVNALIHQARDGVAVEERSDLREVMVKRVTFWRVLAEEQNRGFAISDSKQNIFVSAKAEALGDLVDVLVGNAITHTPSGTSVAIGWEIERGQAVLRVEDAGPGFPAGLDPTARGVSGGGSTGLGLNIARRTVDAAGGSLRLGRSGRMGGALVEVRLPLAGRNEERTG